MFGRKKDKTFSKKQNITPKKDWRVLIYICIGLIILGIGFHLYMYYQISQEEFFDIGSIETPEVPQLDQERLEAVVSDFEKNKKTFEDLQENPPETSDPS